MKLILAQPRGFCAGVDRAIEIVERALTKYGAPVYVRHEIVHNKYVVDDLKQKGAVFVHKLDEIPDGAVTIFSAHGVSSAVENNARNRDLPVIDATCPLVTKVHKQAQRKEKEGREIVLIGHQGHPEVEGTSGRVEQEVLLVSCVEDVEKIQVNDPDKLAYVTQTTLSVNETKDIIMALQAKFPAIVGPDINDICYATQNRQDAIAQLAQQVDVVLVVGAENSSNSNRLRDLAADYCDAYLINTVADVNLAWLVGAKKIGITAGASAPELLVQEIVDYFKAHHDASVETMVGVVESTHFKLPKILQSS